MRGLLRFLMKLSLSRFWQPARKIFLHALPLCLASLAAVAQSGMPASKGVADAAPSISGAGSGSGSGSVSGNSEYSYSKGLQLVQRVDNVLFGVDPLSLAPLGTRHVSGVLIRVGVGQIPNQGISHATTQVTTQATTQVTTQSTAQATNQNANRASLMPGYSHFVADCRKPLRIHIVATATSPHDLSPQGASARARYSAASAALDDGVFAKAHMLDGSWAVAEFACDSTQRPARTAQIARELFEKGGPSDMRTALCDLQTDGDLQTRQDVEVRFSDSEKVVAVNKQWLTSGKVTDGEISFGSGAARWRIDRAAAEASLVHPSGKVAFVGSCIARDAP